MGHRIVLANLLLVALVLTASPAAAARPVTETFERRDVFSVDCGDFLALFDDHVRGRVTTFSDENNNPNEYVGHLRIVGTITHSVTGQSIRDHASINFRGNLPAQDDLDEDRHGVFFHLNVPGQGVVTLVAGRIVTDGNGNAIFTAGPNTEVLQEQSVAIVCEGLSNLG